MRERVRLVGGGMSIDSRVGGGTRISGRVPVPVPVPVRA
jgi:signal transduction histidine kinase